MDQKFTTILSRISQPLHKQNLSGSLTIQRALSNDILFDLDPAKTLEAFTSPSSPLSSVVEDVSQSERAFGIRALIACKSIQEWLEELSSWPWPKSEGLTGFEMISINERRATSHMDKDAKPNFGLHDNYIGCFTETQVAIYESRINQIHNAMEDLRVDEIKRQVLDTHFSSNSRPSSSYSNTPLPNIHLIESYSKIKDFTAIITASILQALPRLSKLVRLMDVWGVRLCILWKIPAFLIALEDTEIALKSGWNAIQPLEDKQPSEMPTKSQTLSRETFNVIRCILQEKVTALGQRLDSMLNVLEGTQDTLPDSWLERMEVIEENYGEWVVAGDRQIRRGELLKLNTGYSSAYDEGELKKTSSGILNSTSGHIVHQASDQQTAHSIEIIKSPKVVIEPKISREKSLELQPRGPPINDKEVFKSPTITDANLIEARPTSSVGCQTLEDINMSGPNLKSSLLNQLIEERETITLEETSFKHKQLKFQDEQSGRLHLASNQSTVLEKSRDERFCLDGSSDCYENPISKSSVDIVRNSPLVSNHGLNEGLYISNLNVKVTPQHTPHNNDEFKKNYSSEISGTSISSASLLHKNVPTEYLPKNSMVTPLNHHTPNNEPEATSSTAQTGTGLRPSPNHDFSINRKDVRTPIFKEPHNFPKQSSIDFPNLNTDGCTESRLVTKLTKKYDNLNSSNVKLSSVHQEQRRSVSLPSKVLANIGRRAPIINSTNSSSEPQNFVQLDTSLNTVPSSTKVSFRSESGLQYSLNIPFNGNVTYTKNTLPISTIFSSVDIASLNFVTSGGHMLSLTPSLPGIFKVTTPQPIVSVYYRDVTSSVINDNFKKLDPGFVPEISRNEIAQSKTFLNKPVTEISSNLSKSPPHIIQSTSEDKISTVSVKQITVPPSALLKSIVYQDSNFGSDQRIKKSPSMHIDNDVTPSKKNSFQHFPVHIDYSTPPKDSNTSSLVPSLDNSPDTDKTVVRPLFRIDERCQLSGQVNFLKDVSFDVTPPDSPLVQTRKSRSKSFGSDLPKNPLPLVVPKQQKIKSSTPKMKTKLSDEAKGDRNDQFQRQISSLLETIPSLICLSPQSDSKMINSKPIRHRESHRSPTSRNQTTSTPTTHSLSQQSTPVYTLVPANAKVSTRSKHHNNNSEIRVYHLSRSNGEAPIKLFVRLVGEHGERVMVRVGGGWADLGEYLKEFASHHGRLTFTDTVRIHDAPSRKSSANTLRSSSVCRDNGRSSPHQRRMSVIEQRPKSSLEIPKTRRSTGMSSIEIFESNSSMNNPRCPSTPVPVIKHAIFETPPSGASSNGTLASTSVKSEKSSRMSWNEEDFNLGLAGPRSKKMTISERDQEWIESMKEKVRLASAEKDRRNQEHAERIQKGRNRGLSLDGFDKVGGTRRLFRRDGSVA